MVVYNDNPTTLETGRRTTPCEFKATLDYKARPSTKQNNKKASALNMSTFFLLLFPKAILYNRIYIACTWHQVSTHLHTGDLGDLPISQTM